MIFIDNVPQCRKLVRPVVYVASVLCDSAKDKIQMHSFVKNNIDSKPSLRYRY